MHETDEKCQLTHRKTISFSHIANRPSLCFTSPPVGNEQICLAFLQSIPALTKPPHSHLPRPCVEEQTAGTSLTPTDALLVSDPRAMQQRTSEPF